MSTMNEKEPLTGEELLKKVKELEHLSQEEKAKACGYYTLTKGGLDRVNMMAFLNALIDAEGIELDGMAKGTGSGGRSASYRITVQSNGNLLNSVRSADHGGAKASITNTCLVPKQFNASK